MDGMTVRESRWLHLPSAGPVSQDIVMAGVGGGVAARKECEESAQ